MSEAHRESLKESLAGANLSPGSANDLIPDDFEPTTQLGIKYDDKEVKLGNMFRAHECKKPPTISFKHEKNASSDASYLLVLTDPDAPTPDNPQYAFWRHWVIPGLMPLSEGKSVVAETKPALTEYLGPGPKDDSGPHRYMFLLYREPQPLDLSKEDVGGEEFVQRRSWRPDEFAKKHGLELVGVNWMTCVGDGWKE